MSQSDLPPLNWLRAFEAASRHLSFTLAAKELNVTQSAVSQHVRSLEGWLGHELFVRQTRALSLTEIGANYLPIVREAFAVLSTGTRAFVAGDRGSVLRLNCNMAFATWWLAPRISRLKARAPWLTLNLLTSTWGGLRDPGNTDIDIRFGRAEDMSPEAQLFLTETLTPICAPDFADGDPDWRRDPLLDCAGLIAGWQVWAESLGETLPPTQRIDVASTYVISLTAAINGQGLALAQDFMIEGLRQTSPVLVPWAHSIPLVEAYFLVPPPPHAETPATKVFRDWFAEETSERPTL